MSIEELQESLLDLREENKQFKSQMEVAEKREIRRSEKERIQEERVLVRDLFAPAKQKLIKEMKNHAFPERTTRAVYGSAYALYYCTQKYGPYYH